MDHLEDRLRRSRAARFRAIVTAGLFPLDGSVANLAAICGLAEKYDALVIVDDRDGVGVLGPTGRGTPQLCQVTEKVDVVTGTFGNAFGGGQGGFVSGRREIIAWLRQKSRPHFISSSLAPASAASALAALSIATRTSPHDDAVKNARVFRAALVEGGFRVMPGDHPIIAVLLGDAVHTQRLTDQLYKKGYFVMGFCHPVVPEGTARIRTQVTANHSQKSLRTAAGAFAAAARDLKIPMTPQPASTTTVNQRV
jgi:glycine C-acetyltransferase